jgi:hypothetical protein
VTIEEKLMALADCGLKLKDEFSVDDLNESWGRKALDEPGYDLALVCLGMTKEEPPWTPHCDNLWHFDTACIEDDGDYVRIVNRMSGMAQGSLPLANVRDHVDIEAAEAWIRFTYQGEEFQIDCDVDDDWVDHKVFGHFVDLLAKHDPDKVYVYYDLGGQDCIIGCVTREQLAKLKGLIPRLQLLE